MVTIDKDCTQMVVSVCRERTSHGARKKKLQAQRLERIGETVEPEGFTAIPSGASCIRWPNAMHEVADNVAEFRAPPAGHWITKENAASIREWLLAFP
jgi:hypothetical protein